jgi:hypothetical protein
MGFAPVAQLLQDRQAARVGGAFGSECFAAAEHVPDRLGQSAGEVDLSDLRAALLADPRLRLVAVAVGGVGAGVRRCFDERQRWYRRPCLLSDRAGRVHLTGRRAGRGRCSPRACAEWGAADVANLGGDCVGEYPADPGHRQQQWHVAVVGAEPAQGGGDGSPYL